MALAATGDQRAFATLVTRHEARIRRLVTLLVGDRERARELAQDVFMIAWARRDAYRATAPWRAWIAGIARNLAARERRRARVRSLFGLATPPAWTAPAMLPAPDAGLETLAAADRERVVVSALARLPPKMREALVLRFVEGLDYTAMSNALGVSASTLRSRVHHGLAQLGPYVPQEMLR